MASCVAWPLSGPGHSLELRAPGLPFFKVIMSLDILTNYSTRIGMEYWFYLKRWTKQLYQNKARMSILKRNQAWCYCKHALKLTMWIDHIGDELNLGLKILLGAVFLNQIWDVHVVFCLTCMRGAFLLH